MTKPIFEHRQRPLNPVGKIGEARTREEAALDVARDALRMIGHQVIDPTLFAIHARAALGHIAELMGEALA